MIGNEPTTPPNALSDQLEMSNDGAGNEGPANEGPANDGRTDDDGWADVSDLDTHDGEATPDSHRGAFGDFGGESSGLIERSFRERIVLVGVCLDDDMATTESHLDELARLIDTAGADEVDRIVQKRRSPDPATYIGKGKVEELKALCDAHDVDTVVFDADLSPAQQFKLEKALERTALDRTAVILDIFAQNAHSTEGRAQVELAQLQYLTPRLRGRGTALSQQGGGIGTRGPGETKLEVDRRRIGRRIAKLEADLEIIGQHRSTQRKARRQSRVPSIAIVGYTNAGKSTLLNCLTDAGVLVEDRLFATLDATTRRLDLPGGRNVLLIDTVGFVRKLPHSLVEAFKSTLDVVAEADLLVHVTDGSAPDVEEMIDAVRLVLAQIDAHQVPEVMVFNKADRGQPGAALLRRYPGSVVISASSGLGVDDLLQEISDRLAEQSPIIDLVIPFDQGAAMAALHRDGDVLVEEACESGMHFRVRLAAHHRRDFDAFLSVTSPVEPVATATVDQS